MECVEKGRRDGGMKRAVWFPILVSCILAHSSNAQSVRSLINGGNNLYQDRKYDEAEVNYRKALEKEQGSVPGHFNLGNSLNKQGKFDQSVKEFETAAVGAQEKGTKAQALYNIGNAYVDAGQYDLAVKSYIESLERNPNDEDAKYNLSYALRKKKEQQQQNNQKQNQQQQQQDKGNQSKTKNPQQQQQNQPQSEQHQQENDKKNPQQQQVQEKQMSRADAERILEVLKNNEKDVQKKLRVKALARAKTDKDW